MRGLTPLLRRSTGSISAPRFRGESAVLGTRAAAAAEDTFARLSAHEHAAAIVASSSSSSSPSSSSSSSSSSVGSSVGAVFGDACGAVASGTVWPLGAGPLDRGRGGTPFARDVREAAHEEIFARSVVLGGAPDADAGKDRFYAAVRRRSTLVTEDDAAAVAAEGQDAAVKEHTSTAAWDNASRRSANLSASTSSSGAGSAAGAAASGSASGASALEPSGLWHDLPTPAHAPSLFASYLEASLARAAGASFGSTRTLVLFRPEEESSLESFESLAALVPDLPVSDAPRPVLTAARAVPGCPSTAPVRRGGVSREWRDAVARGEPVHVPAGIVAASLARGMVVPRRLRVVNLHPFECPLTTFPGWVPIVGLSMREALYAGDKAFGADRARFVREELIPAIDWSAAAEVVDTVESAVVRDGSVLAEEIAHIAEIEATIGTRVFAPAMGRMEIVNAAKDAVVSISDHQNAAEGTFTMADDIILKTGDEVFVEELGQVVKGAKVEMLTDLVEEELEIASGLKVLAEEVARTKTIAGESSHEGAAEQKDWSIEQKAMNTARGVLSGLVN